LRSFAKLGDWSHVSRRINVLCIGGTGQNGGTLLSRMLGRLPGFVAVGELGRIWDIGILRNVECGCGKRFHDCPFWNRVGQEAFGGWEAVDAARAASLRDELVFKRRRLPNPLALPLILWPSLSSGYRQKLEEYGQLLERLYLAISVVSEASVIVDSMKVPAHVYTVSRLKALDLRVVHLVRDSRGVAYSNVKWVRRQAAGGAPYRARREPARTGMRWVWVNLAFQQLARRVPSLFLNYESLVRSPKTELVRIARHAGMPVGEGSLGFVGNGEVELGPDHLVAGNRMRLHSGTLQLRTDEEWRTRLTRSQRRAVSLVTLPLLRLYGYGLRDPAT
jgi:hypothetical protein